MKFKWLCLLIAWGSVNIAVAQQKKKTVPVKKRPVSSHIRKSKPAKKKAKASGKKAKPLALKKAIAVPPTSTATPVVLSKEQLLQAHDLFRKKQIRESLSLYETYANTPLMDTQGYRNMGLCYKQLNASVAQDYQKAATYFLKAIHFDGDALSCLYLGQLYLTGGHGLQRNAQEALPYLEQAYRQGNQEAQFELGRLYLVGSENLLKNEPKGLGYLEDVAKKGHADAQWLLGNTYAKGTATIPKNLPLAKTWFKLYQENMAKQNKSDW